ncbi:hypothetical protein EC99P1_00066 [Enterococcus phage EC99P1]|nr:hypothetical protein EC99P1_00066 [Enterococcus phage EC99P1]
MTKIVLSHEDYERVLQEGMDLDAYLQGRFDEAASAIKYLNEEVDVTVPLIINGSPVGEAFKHINLQTEVAGATYQAESVTCESGRTYAVRDAVVFPNENEVAIIVQVDSGDDGFPARVYWEERKFAEWLSDDDFEGSFKIN